MATNTPSHNVAEIIDAVMLLVEQPEASHEQIMALVQGPDFATGGIVIDSPAAIQDAYATGRGAFRVRSRWHKEDEGRGNWVAVITEIPYQVQKGKLIEQTNQLNPDTKLQLLGDLPVESEHKNTILL